MATAVAMPGAPDQRLPGRVGVSRDRFGRRPNEQRGLQSLPTDSQHRHEDQTPPGTVCGDVDLATQVTAERASGPRHPEDHPGDQSHGKNRQGATDGLLGLETEPTRAEEQGEPERQSDGDRGPDADPDARQQVATSGLHQIRDQDAHHEGSLEALTQTDQVVRQHGDTVPD